MKFYNTLSRTYEEVVPIEAGHIGMYTCGPTVYDHAHIGNFRAYIFEDLLRRYLKYHGWRVTQVMNLTDVDDKTIRGAIAAGKSLDEYTSGYKQAFFDDLKVLNIEPVEHYPAATDHIPEMIELIEKLIEKGYAYKSDDGSVYFSIAKFADYGKLAHLDMAGLRPGARVSQDEYEKESVADFALWKAWSEDDGEVAWAAPWGRGRPGWHIECSAMSTKYLGNTFDIHTGGIDNIFPHHEDEIAQSEAASGQKFVNMWMHCAHLVVEGRKMSKSLGNFYTLRDILERGYTGREVRYVLIGTNYRQTLNFTFAALDGARAALARMDEFRQRLSELAEHTPSADSRLPEWALSTRDRFEAALDDDLNVSEALAALFDMVHSGNRALDAGQDADGAAAALDLMAAVDRVLGCPPPEGGEVQPEVMALVEEREAVRKARDWEQSDRIRDQLAQLGWEVRDTPEGAKLKRIGA